MKKIITEILIGQRLPPTEEQISMEEMIEALLTGPVDAKGYLDSALSTVEHILNAYSQMGRNPINFLQKAFGPFILWRTFILDINPDDERLDPAKCMQLLPVLSSSDFFWGTEYGEGLMFLTATISDMGHRTVFYAGDDRYTLDAQLRMETDIDRPTDVTCQIVEHPVSRVVHALYEDGLPLRCLSDWEIEDREIEEDGD